MAKRFTGTDIWDEDWFLDLPKDYKLFWFYLKDKCDHAGIFKVNVRVFNFIHETDIESDKAFTLFNKGKKRLRKVKDGVWLLEDFFIYQYGEKINLNNRVHESIKKQYDKYKIDLTSICGLIEVK